MHQVDFHIGALAVDCVLAWRVEMELSELGIRRWPENQFTVPGGGELSNRMVFPRDTQFDG